MGNHFWIVWKLKMAKTYQNKHPSSGPSSGPSSKLGSSFSNSSRIGAAPSAAVPTNGGGGLRPPPPPPHVCSFNDFQEIDRFLKTSSYIFFSSDSLMSVNFLFS